MCGIPSQTPRSQTIEGPHQGHSPESRTQEEVTDGSQRGIRLYERTPSHLEGRPGLPAVVARSGRCRLHHRRGASPSPKHARHGVGTQSLRIQGRPRNDQYRGDRKQETPPRRFQELCGREGREGGGHICQGGEGRRSRPRGGQAPADGQTGGPTGETDAPDPSGDRLSMGHGGPPPGGDRRLCGRHAVSLRHPPH